MIFPKTKANDICEKLSDNHYEGTILWISWYISWWYTYLVTPYWYSL